MFSKPSLGIRGRILFIAVLPLLLMTLILIVVIYRGHIVDADAALSRQGRLLAAQLAANLEYALSTGSMMQISDTIMATVQPATNMMNMPVHRVTVMNNQTEVLHQKIFDHPSDDFTLEHRWIEAWMNTHAYRAFDAEIFLDPLNVVKQHNQTRRLLGLVSIEMSLLPLWATQFERLLKDLLWVAALVVLATGLSHSLGRRVSLAVEEIAQAIMQIKAGDLQTRIVKTHTGELGTLQEGVNLLAEAVFQSQTKLDVELTKVRAEYDHALQALTVESERTESANRAKSRFLASVSHDLRTPLYTIQALTEQQLNSPQLETRQHDLQHIHNASHALLSIINEILDFIQLEESRYHSISKPFELWAELETVIETVEFRARQKMLFIDLIVTPAVPRLVKGDRKALRAIAMNLITNAIMYTDHGGVTVRIDRAADQSTDPIHITLTVEDTGCGISSQQQDRVFRAVRAT